jgi:hypothetical protein
VNDLRYDDWEKPPHVRDAWERVARAAERGPDKPELTRSYELPAKALTAGEFAEFESKGRKIDYGEARMAKQCLNDDRHEERAKRHPLIDLVIEVLREWDCAEYLAKHRKTVRDILAKPRNQRRRKLAGMSTKQRRHQQAIRLLRSLVYEGSAADYCRQTGLDEADASRMLAHLYEKEPGLLDAIVAISACGTVTSWQNRQENKKFPNRERVEIVYGYDYQDVADNGWLSDVPSSRFRSVRSGCFKPIEQKFTHEPFVPLDLHLPETWHKMQVHRQPLVFADGRYCSERLQRVLDWYEPMRAAQRYNVPLCYGVYDRYRELSRTLQFKDGSPKVKRIGRAIPILDWDTRPLGYCPQHWYPVPDIWVGWDPAQARYEALALVGGYVPESDARSGWAAEIRTSGNKRWMRLERWMRERKWAPGPMCRPTRSLSYQPTGSKWVQTFSRISWTFLPVTHAETAAARVGPGIYRIFLTCPLRRDASNTSQHQP